MNDHVPIDDDILDAWAIVFADLIDRQDPSH